MDQDQTVKLQSAREFLVGYGGSYPASIEEAAKTERLTLPYIENLTPAMEVALLDAGWKPPTRKPWTIDDYRQALMEKRHEAGEKQAQNDKEQEQEQEPKQEQEQEHEGLKQAKKPKFRL